MFTIHTSVSVLRFIEAFGPAMHKSPPPLPPRLGRWASEPWARRAVVNIDVRVGHPPPLTSAAARNRRVGGGYTHAMNGRSRMTIDPRIPTMPVRISSGFQAPGHARGEGDSDMNHLED